MTQARRSLGAEGEALAARWYESQGYEVLARNWRCREGELDLVLRRGHTIVFCEVKSRSSEAFGVPAEAVTRTKQARLRTLAALWLADTGLGRGKELRFDVASVLRGELEVLTAAF